MIDIITNVRRKKKNRKKKRKTGGIDVRHFGNVLDSSFAGKGTEYYNIEPSTFYISPSRDWPGLLGRTEANPILRITEIDRMARASSGKMSRSAAAAHGYFFFGGIRTSL